MMKAPSERARLYFLLAWFHAIVQERLRYVPLGWAKYYEFNESDLRVACDTLDTWIEATAMVRIKLQVVKSVDLMTSCIREVRLITVVSYHLIIYSIPVNLIIVSVKIVSEVVNKFILTLYINSLNSVSFFCHINLDWIILVYTVLYKHHFTYYINNN